MFVSALLLNLNTLTCCLSNCLTWSETLQTEVLITNVGTELKVFNSQNQILALSVAEELHLWKLGNYNQKLGRCFLVTVVSLMSGNSKTTNNISTEVSVESGRKTESLL